MVYLSRPDRQKMMRIKNSKPYFTREASYKLVLRDSKEKAEKLLISILARFGDEIKRQVAAP